MFSFFKSKNNQPKARKLFHPSDLRAGDIIKFQYLKQAEISGKEFEVSQVNTYIYGNLCYPEMVLKDRSGNLIYMMVEDDDGEEYLALSKKVARSAIDEIISNEDLAKILAKGTGTKLNIKSTKPKNLEEWLVDSYKEVEDGIKGSFLKGDARYLSNQEISQQDSFISHTLESSDEEYALELEIYTSGERELSVTIYAEITEIEDMWPAENSTHK